MNLLKKRSLLSKLLALFFRLLYHPLAWIYDTVAAVVSVGRWKRWVMAAEGQLAGNRILELGFGPGHLQARLYERSILVFGLDESAQMARQARRRLIRRRHPYRLVRGLAQNLPYRAGSFDSVVATFPTPYIFHPSTLAEVNRVLVSGGKLVVLYAAWITGTSLFDRAAALLFQLTGQVPQAAETSEDLLDPFRLAGFDAEVRELNLHGSRLLFVIAVKPTAT
jgi:ubiquinone/menaquinone biosynthesis C-methylase UbiE